MNHKNRVRTLKVLQEIGLRKKALQWHEEQWASFVNNT